ncbi:hypothetical protein [Vitreoscilla filiformis]|nr:hypothetical protein [Vitreoscilla filiformis]
MLHNVSSPSANQALRGFFVVMLVQVWAVKNTEFGEQNGERPQPESRLALVGTCALPPSKASGRRMDAHQFLRDQADKTLTLLSNSPELWAVLKTDSFFASQKSAIFSEATLVEWVRDAPLDGVAIRKLFLAIRRSLKKAKTVAEKRKAAEAAAVGLYALAACRLVLVSQSATSTKVLDINTPVSFLCAVLAVSLFGGTLDLRGVDEHGCPMHSGVFYVRLAPDGDWSGFDIERAAYCAIFKSSAAAMDVSEVSAPLSKQESADLCARLETLRDVDQIGVALVVVNPFEALNPEDFADKADVPIFKMSKGVDQALFGMAHEDLVAGLREFWSELQTAQPSELPQTQASHAGAQERTMGNQIHVTVHGGTVAVALAENAMAQAGNNNTMHKTHQQGAQWDQLLANLQGLKVVAGDMPASKVADKLNARIDEALVLTNEAQTQPEKKGLLKTAIESIQDLAELAEGGEKLAVPIAGLIALVAPLLGA